MSVLCACFSCVPKVRFVVQGIVIVYRGCFDRRYSIYRTEEEEEEYEETGVGFVTSGNWREKRGLISMWEVCEIQEGVRGSAREE